MKFLKGLLGFITFVAGYLAIVIFSPFVKAEPQPMKKVPSELPAPPEREDFSIYVNGVRVDGWFYKADVQGPAPCIILSHGFSGTKDTILEKYALKFIRNGYHALTYDYRHYGTSGGEPRQLYCGQYQVEDLKAMLTYATCRNDVDGNRIFLWGTSAGAGYGLTVAAENSQVAGVIGQCGAYDHKADSEIYLKNVGYGFFIKLFIHAQRDKGRSRFGLPPHMFPAYGRPGTVSMINLPGVFEEVEELMQDSETFRNETCGRLAFMPHPPSPIDVADEIDCPVLFVACEKDILASPSSHERLVEKLEDLATIITYPISHFDIYKGKNFEQATDDQLEFIEICLNQ